MARTTTMTVRLSGALIDFVAANVGETGSYENVSEYIGDLIRRDKERAEHEAFARLKAELLHAYAAPESSYHRAQQDLSQNGRRPYPGGSVAPPR
jgi:Arc/MetJ-type ribon-helix-helix transcriptional regulator